MKQFTLAISDPPHGQVDLRKAAPTLGLAAADLRMKAIYQVPEIWLADADRGQVERATRTLREAGLNVRVDSSDGLLEVPRQGAVTTCGRPAIYGTVAIERLGVGPAVRFS